MVDRLTSLMESQQATIEALRQDNARSAADASKLADALVRALDRVGEGQELRERRMEKQMAELRSRVAELERNPKRGKPHLPEPPAQPGGAGG